MDLFCQGADKMISESKSSYGKENSFPLRFSADSGVKIRRNKSKSEGYANGEGKTAGSTEPYLSNNHIAIVVCNSKK